MQLQALVTVLLLLVFSLKSFAIGPAFLDLEDEQIISIFNKPGKNWKNCAQDSSCRPVAWPDSTAKIKILSPTKSLKVENPFTGKVEVEEYALVEYSYQRIVNGKTFKQAGQGWIDMAYVTTSKKSSFYGVDATEKKVVQKENCQPQKSPSPTKGFSQVERALGNKSVKEIAKALSPSVGICTINPKQKNQKFVTGNVYDNYVLPQIRKQKVPKITKENGEAMSLQDLVDIDSLARTIYGEMAGCFKHGLQYPMTVAKIAINRAQAKERESEFIRGSHSSHKSSLAKVVTSESQFSLWKANYGSKPNHSVRLALCPPSTAAKASWQGHAPSKEELEIWENTMRIATEAVLFPKKFQTRTAQVSGYHYTSGMPSFHGMKQVFPWIEERKVSKNACVQVWKETKRS